MNTYKIKKAQEVLKKIIYITLGTSDLQGNPWTTPLFVAFDDDFNFYWISPRNSKHSENIKVNNRVSMVCFDSTVPKWTGIGVYFTAHATEVSDPGEIGRGLELIFARLEEKKPDISAFQGEKEYRVYKATPEQVWITSEKVIDGETVDGREELDIEEFRN